MKTKIIIILNFLLLILCLGFKSNPSSDDVMLIGKWNFVEMLDQDGKHIDTLKDDDGIRIAKEADYTFRKDSTYSAQFTESNIDSGTWSYSPSEKTIILKLYWKKPYDEAALYIISLGFSTKDENGDYYDLIPKKVIELSRDKMIILSRENRKLIYKKVK